MNKRIQELLIQCQHESIDGPEYPRWTDLEKFAELIVRECATMTRNLSPHGELAERAVKEHFGVDK